MVSCIAVETASLVFACLSLLSSCIGTMVCIALMVHMNVLMVYLVNTSQRQVAKISQFEIEVSNYGLYVNIGTSIILAIVIISLFFSIVLIKGLISKKSNLVKAYFIYGVITNSISAILVLLSTLTFDAHMGVGLIGLFLYSIILIMIKITYEKLATSDYDQFCHKKLEAEKTIV